MFCNRTAMRFAARQHIGGHTRRNLLAQLCLKLRHGVLPAGTRVLKKMLHGKCHGGLQHHGFVIGFARLALRHGLQAMQLPRQ